MFVNVRCFGSAINIEAYVHLGGVYHSDLGRTNAVARSPSLFGFRIKPEEVKVMLKDNPAKLMWLDERDAATVAPVAIAGYRPPRT